LNISLSKKPTVTLSLGFIDCQLHFIVYSLTTGFIVNEI